MLRKTSVFEKKLNFLIISSLISIFFMGIFAFGICLELNSIYLKFPELKYEKLAMFLVGTNVIPSIVAVFLVIVFAIKITNDGDFIYNIIRTSKFLERTFFFQGAYIFLSITFISMLENVGVLPIVIFKCFVVFISFSLALFFGVLSKGLSLKNKSNSLIRVCY